MSRTFFGSNAEAGPCFAVSDLETLRPACVSRFPKIGRHETMVLMHNDAVVQGLSEVPFMQDVKRWGILTIGTGLGNARFTNHSQADD